MTWNIDIPDLPFKKPKIIEHLEGLSFDQREAMDPQERKDSVRESAYTMAKAYYEQKKIEGDFEGCVLVVNSALNSMGNALSGKLGADMVGLSNQDASDACKTYYPHDEES